jgi:hypothetical protein
VVTARFPEVALRVHTRGWVEELHAKRCLFQRPILSVL